LENLQYAKEFCATMSAEISAVELVPARSGLPGHVGLELVVERPGERKAVFEELQNSQQVAIALPIHT
jgi:hypothetical protein